MKLLNSALLALSLSLGCFSLDSGQAMAQVQIFTPYNPENSPMHHTDPWGREGAVYKHNRSVARWRGQNREQKEFDRDYMLRGQPRYDVYHNRPKPPPGYEY